MNDLPAILGGTPSVTEDHLNHIKWPIIEDDDMEMVNKVLRDGNLSTHEIRIELEEAYKLFVGRKYGLSHSNGTSALLAAFFAIGLESGDEVLVTSATWWASVSPMLWLGAIPVFCEIESKQLGICIDDMSKKVTPRTKAIVVVHLWGMPSQMEKIEAFAKSHNLKIIEDASHAHGASYMGTPCGRFGDISVFSLQGDKLAPAGEGGIFLTDNYEYWEKAVTLGDVVRIYQLESEARRFAATGFGIKTRMAPLSAAIGLSQLKKLKRNNTKRNTNIEYVSHALEKLGFETFLGNNSITRTYFEFLVRWKNPHKDGTSKLIEALQKEGARVDNPRYPLVHQQPFFTEGHWKEIARPISTQKLPDYSNVQLPYTENSNRATLRLPHFSTATTNFLDQYIKAFEKVMSHIDIIYS